MKLKHLLFLCSFCIFFYGNSQILNYSVDVIPDSLKTGANAVVRYCKEEVTIHNEKSMTTTFSKIITVLNKEGNKYVDVYKNYSKDSKIKKIGAVLYNARGIEILKYKKKDFLDVSAVTGFYSDDRIKYLDFTPRGYPYTIKFEYTFHTNTTLFIPRWFPVDSYGLSVQSKELVINNLSSIKLNHLEKNFGMFKNHKNLSTENTFHYQIKNQKAIKREPFSPYFQNVYPNVKFYLERFSVRRYKSDVISGWKDYGKWQRETLYEGRSELNEETREKVLNLVKDISEPYEKAKLIYEYMQSKTRYVYVGVGIGGLQPSKASDVDRLGYGDCKGLSNYTKALLDVVGVEANCVVVYANEKLNFDKEYHGKEGNHIILNLPKLNKGEDVWLECTSQTKPFGFLGDFTDDRDVLVLEKDGGVIKHTPRYADEGNEQVTKGNVVLDAQGNVKADIKINFTGLQYDDEYWKERLTPKELQKYFKSRRWWYVDNLIVTEHDFTNDKEGLSFVEDLKIKVDDYATILGNEMVLKVNMFHSTKSKSVKAKERQNAVCVRKGYLDTDEIFFEIPEGYDFNQEDIEENVDSKFGEYAMSITKLEGNKLVYKRRFLLKEGQYPKEESKEFSRFLKEVNSNDKTKIILNKK